MGNHQTSQSNAIFNFTLQAVVMLFLAALAKGIPLPEPQYYPGFALTIVISLVTSPLNDAPSPVPTPALIPAPKFALISAAVTFYTPVIH